MQDAAWQEARAPAKPAHNTHHEYILTAESSQLRDGKLLPWVLVCVGSLIQSLLLFASLISCTCWVADYKCRCTTWPPLQPTM
jgi:hypothetical protein